MSAHLESSAVATTLEKVSFPFNPKEGKCQRILKLLYNCTHFNMIARLCSESFKLGFRSVWTENFQMCKMGFKESERPEIKLPPFIGSWSKQGNSRKTSVSLTTWNPLTVWIRTHCGKFLKRWEHQSTLCVSWEICMSFQKQQLERDMK